jgi:pteridine reductase
VTIQSKTALVTGGGVRLGQAMAWALGRAGANVVVHYGRSRQEAEATARELRAMGREAAVVQADFRSGKRSVAEALFAEANRAAGPIDILINSAAIFEEDTLESLSDEHVARHIAINMQSPLFLAQAFVGQLPPERAGHLVNIVDWRALRPKPGHLIYTMTKAALVALTRMLALELAPRVQVNAIAPGAILPPAGARDDYAERLARQIPLRRTGSPDELCRTLLYILQSDFLTGEVICLSGGEQL